VRAGANGARDCSQWHSRIDHAQARVELTIWSPYWLTDIRDIRSLTTKDKKLSFFNVRFQKACIFPNLSRDPHTGLELFSYAGEQRLELLEVLTNGAVGDFLGGALVSSGADMAKLGNVGSTRRAL
jgi:hypothetical protein